MRTDVFCKEKLKLKINGKAVTKSIFKAIAPDFFKGQIKELVKDVSITSFYKIIESDSCLWDKIPEAQKNMLVVNKPWKLDWLTLPFVVNAVLESNEVIGSLIISSHDIQQRMNEEITQLKNKLS